MRTAEITNKKTIVWMAGMGLLFGISSLLVCIIAILNGSIDDMGVSSVIILPIFCSFVLAFIPIVAKNKIRSTYFGIAGALRWFIFGVITGMLYVLKEVLSDNAILPSSIIGILSLFAIFVLYWLLFEQRKRTPN